ncbi:MAG: hypothetical protein ACE5IG_07725, partial [Dehalococcoidia bacterium]
EGGQLRGCDTVLFDEVAGPKEIWVMENEFHYSRVPDGLEGVDSHPFMADWIRDALDGRLSPGHRKYRLVPKDSGYGPYTPEVAQYASVSP